ncbi:MAG: cupredoxin domain-containing protein [Chloroflexota bacterium]
MDALRSLLEWVISLIGPFVAPDWGALIKLIPIGVLALVAAFYGWVLLRYRRAGRRQVGMQILPAARPPEGIHLPGPSLAPFFISIAAASLFFSVAMGGAALAISGAAMVLALIAWGREAVREYDAIGAGHNDALQLHDGADAAPSGPPSGVHLPAPSLLPFLVSAAVAVLLFGAAIGLSFVLLGALMTTLAFIAWLLDAGREYRAVAEADSTGHLINPEPKRVPRISLALFSLLFIAVAGSQFGLFSPAAGEGSPAPGDSGAPSAPPSDGITVVSAAAIKFEQSSIELAAGVPTQLRFHNKDAGIPHNVSIHEGTIGAVGAELFQGAIFNGDDERVYDIPPIAAGSYVFVCTVHPNMVGALTVK